MNFEEKHSLSDIDFERLVSIHSELARVSVNLIRMVDDSGLSKKDIAEKMGISVSKLRRILKTPTYKASAETLAMLAWACGKKLDIKIS